MKVEYKNIRGHMVKQNLHCHECCFFHLIKCIPYSIHRCRDHIFEKVKAQIFNL